GLVGDAFDFHRRKVSLYERMSSWALRGKASGKLLREIFLHASNLSWRGHGVHFSLPPASRTSTRIRLGILPQDCVTVVDFIRAMGLLHERIARPSPRARSVRVPARGPARRADARGNGPRRARRRAGVGRA